MRSCIRMCIKVCMRVCIRVCMRGGVRVCVTYEGARPYTLSLTLNIIHHSHIVIVACFNVQIRIFHLFLVRPYSMRSNSEQAFLPSYGVWTYLHTKAPIHTTAKANHQ